MIVQLAVAVQVFIAILFNGSKERPAPFRGSRVELPGDPGVDEALIAVVEEVHNQVAQVAVVVQILEDDALLDTHAEDLSTFEGPVSRFGGYGKRNPAVGAWVVDDVVIP